MLTAAEVQRILAAQPLARMRHFAELLGWRGLQLRCVNYDEAPPGRFQGVVIFYETTDEKFNLQINTYPHGQAVRHRATVKADRYGIGHLGWHDFELFESDLALQQEAERVRPWLERQMFRNPARRRQLRRKLLARGIARVEVDR